MFATKNDLSDETRGAMCELLNTRLAEAIDLSLQAKQAHWNVKGPHFYQLHLLFDQVHDVVEEFIDLIAERVAQLGGVAEGTIQAVTQRSGLAEYPRTISDGMAHVQALSTALGQFGAKVRQEIHTTAEHGDADTSDILTEVSRGIDKQLWFVEAHLQGGR